MAQGFAALALAQGAAQDGVALFEQHKYAEAKKVLSEVVAREPGNAEAHAYLALVFLNFVRDTDQAVEHLQQAVKLADGNAKYHNWLGACYGRKAATSGVFKAMSAASKCRAEFERAVALDPNYTEARFSLLQYYLNAPGIAGGSVAKAKEQAAALARIKPYQGALAFGTIAEYEKQPARAEESYRQAIAAEPSNGDAYNQLGYFFLRQNRPKDALAQFRRLVELAPDQANSYDSLADGYVADGSVDEALESYKKALTIDPAFSSSVFGLAQCYEKKALWQDAARTFKRYLELAPSGRQADTARRKLQEIGKKQG